jgi:hypothetical protein
MDSMVASLESLFATAAPNWGMFGWQFSGKVYSWTFQP